MFYLTNITVSCNKKGQIPIQTTQSNFEFSMSRRDAYYHSYQNPPTPRWRWHIYNGLHQIWAWSEKCAIGLEKMDYPGLSEITGLLADSGELNLGKSGIITDPLFVYLINTTNKLGSSCCVYDPMYCNALHFTALPSAWLLFCPWSGRRLYTPSSWPLGGSWEPVIDTVLHGSMNLKCFFLL